MSIFCRGTIQTETYETKESNGIKWDFNFCESPFKTNSPECNDVHNDTYAFRIDKGSSCKPFSFDDEGKTDTAGSEIKSDENVITGLVLTYSGTDDCATGNNGKESLQVQINCPADVLDGKYKATDKDHWQPLKLVGDGEGYNKTN